MMLCRRYKKKNLSNFTVTFVSVTYRLPNRAIVAFLSVLLIVLRSMGVSPPQIPNGSNASIA